MSKKNKLSPGKAAKKSPPKKAVKPPAKKSNVKVAAKTTKQVTKPTAKKSPAKAARPVQKPVAKKPVNVTKSKLVAKSAPKKTMSKTQVTSKKTVLPKKTAKPISKIASKPVKAIVKPAQKPVAKTPVKPVKQAPINEKAKAAKETPKPIPVEVNDEKSKKTIDSSSKKSADKKPQEVLAITNTIPVKVMDEISASKIASISHSITNPIKKTDSYAIKPEKEPNGKFELEFVVHSSAEMLYEFLSTPSGLSEWFCDDLNIRNGIYTFIWNDQLQQARLLKTIEQQLVRFQWVDKTDGSYFEFRIQRDDLTNDIALIITDFADSAGDRESSKLLWNSQVEKLMHVIGSIF